MRPASRRVRTSLLTPYPRHGAPVLSISRDHLLMYICVCVTPRRSRDVQHESSLLYTRHRDIHAVGIVLLQMLLGLDVTDHFSNVQYALMSGACLSARWLDDLIYSHTYSRHLSVPRAYCSQYDRASKEEPYHVFVAPCRFSGDVEACAEDGEEECAYCDHGCAFRWVYAPL
jgi:hypothetical protein